MLRTLVLNSGIDLISNVIWVGKDVGLPEAQNRPTRGLKRCSLAAIALSVVSYLREPIFCVVSFGELRKPLVEVTSVPEVSIAEYSDPLLHEYDVRPAR